jgi:transposase-like protein
MGEDALRALVERTSRAPDPCESLRILTALRREVDQLERELVARALAGGRSFADIAQALGVSRQAAHRRYRHLAGTVPPERPAAPPVAAGRGSTRLVITSEARQAFAHAREEARALGAVRVGTEHLLLGVLRSDGTAIADTLADLGVTLELARAHAEPTAVSEHAVVDDDAPAPALPPPPEGISRYLRSVLERALREAVARGQDAVGLDGLLLAALADEDGGACRTLLALGVEPDTLRARLQP